MRVRIRGPVDDLGTVQCEAARVLGLRALVGQQHREPTNIAIRHWKERVEFASVQRDPGVPHMVAVTECSTGYCQLVVLENDLAARIDRKAHIEESIRKQRVPAFAWAMMKMFQWRASCPR